MFPSKILVVLLIKFFKCDCGSDSPGEVQEVSAPGGGGCRDAGRARDFIGSTHQAVVKDTRGQI